MNITYAVTYFDFNSSGKFRPLLEQWVAYARAAIESPRIAILADNFTSVPELGAEVVRVEPLRFLLRPQHMPGAAFDYKAALICAALNENAFRGPMLICDSDATILNDPTSVLGSVGGAFAMPPDPGKRKMPLDHIEHSSCTLWFPQPEYGSQIAGAYAFCYEYLASHAQEQTGIEAMLREQRSWSLALSHTRPNGELLPAQFGWSPQCWGENQLAYIRHAHGEKKWEMLPVAAK